MYFPRIVDKAQVKHAASRTIRGTFEAFEVSNSGERHVTNMCVT